MELPPLAERSEDIPLLAHYLLERHNVAGRKQLGGFAPEAMDAAAAEWGEAIGQWYQCESANHWPAYPVGVATINPYQRGY
jgi:hypothetical protein